MTCAGAMGGRGRGQRETEGIRDVDQSNGEDLLPMGRGEDAVNPSSGPRVLT